MSVLKHYFIFGVIIGVVAIILGIVLGFAVLTENIEERLHDKVRLEIPESYRNWRQLPYEITTKFYFFNIDNFHLILSGEYPNITEVGPIVYKQTRIKENIVYNKTSDSYAYDERVQYRFDEDASIPLRTRIHTLNLIKYLSILYVDEIDKIKAFKKSFQHLFTDTANEQIFHEMRLEQLLFAGYECMNTANFPTGDTNVLQLRSIILNRLEDNVRLQQDPLKNAHIFSLVKYKQDYIENRYEMYGGSRDIAQQGKFRAINNEEYLHVWPEYANATNICNSIAGTTDGHTLPVNIDSAADISIFNNDLCRCMNFSPIEEEAIIKDMTGKKYAMKSDCFDYNTDDNESQCFCIEPDNACPLDGYLNLNLCYGMPIIASKPHFLDVNDVLTNELNVSPNQEHHGSYVTILTESGSLLSSARRIQYNINLKPIKDFAPAIKPITLPLYWVEESMIIPDSSIETLNVSYFDHLQLIEIVKWSLIGSGIAIVAVCITALLIILCKRGKS